VLRRSCHRLGFCGDGSTGPRVTPIRLTKSVVVPRRRIEPARPIRRGLELSRAQTPAEDRNFQAARAEASRRCLVHLINPRGQVPPSRVGRGPEPCGLPAECDMTLRKLQRSRLSKPLGFRSIARAHLGGKPSWKSATQPLAAEQRQLPQRKPIAWAGRPISSYPHHQDDLKFLDTST
jgi:hypothetical protein